MRVYFFESCRGNLVIIKRIIQQWNGENCRFFVNESLMAVFEGLDSKEETVVFINTRIHKGQSNSFDLAVKIREKSADCHIVFMSSYPQDMAFCLKNLIRPSGFLLEPLVSGDVAAILRMIYKSEKNKSREATDKILINCAGVKYAFLPDEILYFSTLGKKITCRTVRGEVIEFYSTLKGIEAAFSTFFIRCHSGFLANKKNIIGMAKNSLTLRNCPDNVPVSKKYKSAVIEYMKSG